MRNLLSLFGLLVIGFAGIGWYMGWYKLSVTRGTDGNLEIKTDVDTKKVETDSTDARSRTSGTAIGSHVEKAAQDTGEDQSRLPVRPGEAAPAGLLCRSPRRKTLHAQPADAGRSSCTRSVTVLTPALPPANVHTLQSNSPAPITLMPPK